MPLQPLLIGSPSARIVVCFLTEELNMFRLALVSSLVSLACAPCFASSPPPDKGVALFHQGSMGNFKPEWQKNLQDRVYSDWFPSKHDVSDLTVISVAITNTGKFYEPKIDQSSGNPQHDGGVPPGLSQP